jgi:hypothetical protein
LREPAIDNEREIGKRLRNWGLGQYGSLGSFAEALRLRNQNTLSPYFSGVRKPGNSLQSRLRELGCDVEWLMTGRQGVDSPVSNHHALGGQSALINVYGVVNSDSTRAEYSKTEVVGSFPWFSSNAFGLIISSQSLIHAPLPGGRVGLNPDDLAIFERRHPRQGEIVCVVLDDGYRRLGILKKKNSNLVLLANANRFINILDTRIPAGSILEMDTLIISFPLTEVLKDKMGI